LIFLYFIISRSQFSSHSAPRASLCSQGRDSRLPPDEGVPNPFAALDFDPPPVERFQMRKARLTIMFKVFRICIYATVTLRCVVSFWLYTHPAGFFRSVSFFCFHLCICSFSATDLPRPRQLGERAGVPPPEAHLGHGVRRLHLEALERARLRAHHERRGTPRLGGRKGGGSRGWSWGLGKGGGA
jgi:hypothetical protein